MLSLRIITLLFILIIILSNCTRTIYKCSTPICYHPIKVKLDEIPEDSSSLDIQKIMLNNLNKCILYSKELEITLKCYTDSLKECKNEEK